MNLLQATHEQLNWLISIGRKIRKLTPREALGSITAFLFGQLFLVLAFFLPLKVILLLATDGIPWYLAAVVTIETKNHFILGLALGAIASYGLYLVCEWLISNVVCRGARRIIARTNKLTLFNDQDNFARDGFYRLCRAFASGILIVLGFALGLYLNPLLFAALAALVIVEYTVLQWLLNRTNAVGMAVAQHFRLKQSLSFNVLSASNFLFGFGILFAQYVVSDNRNVIVAILCILLTRQLMNRLSVGSQDLIYLARNRLKLNALFYSSIQYLPPQDLQHNDFLTSMESSQRDEWLASAISEAVEKPTAVLSSIWIDSGVAGIVILDVMSTHQANDVPKRDGTSRPTHYLVKCYHESRAMLAAHEVDLFATMGGKFECMPTLLGEVMVNKGRVLICHGLPNLKASSKQWKRLELPTLLALWSVAPDPVLSRTYLRSHPTIIDRVTTHQIATLRVATADSAERRCLEELLENWPAVQESIRALPLVLRNPDISPALCHIDAQERCIALSWTRWSVEPIGCSRLIHAMKRSELDDALASLKKTRPDAVELTQDNLLLVSWLAEFEIRLMRKQYRAAIEIIDKILARELNKSGDTSCKPPINAI